MTNEEKAKEIGQKWYNDGANEVAFRSALQMAKWKDEQMIEKACEWLKHNAEHFTYISAHSGDAKISEHKLIEEFEKAMEE